MSNPTVPPPAAPAPLVDAQHPWLGLLPFKEAQRDFFFGRDAEITEILGRIRENLLTILFGQSGLGKTSLLGAAVVPALRETTFAPVLLRLDHAVGAPSLLEQTRDAFRRALPGIAWPEDAAAVTLWELFHRNPGLLPSEGPVPVLLFDQFEEIFTLGRQDRAREQEAALWLEQVADLLQNRPPRSLEDRFAGDRRLARDYDFSPAKARMVFALREDYLSHLEGWKSSLPLLTQNRMGLHLLNGPQALEAVLGPASLGESPLLSRDVAADIVRTVARVEADTPLPRIRAVPPLLSLLCEQLNAARLAAGATEISADMVTGQSADILQRFYVESFASFPPAHRETIRALIEDPPMITEGGYRNSLVREDAEAYLAQKGVPNPRAVFDTLIQRRVITVEEKDRVQRLEVTHDVLVPLLVRSRRERRDRVAKEKAERALAEQNAQTRKRRLFTAAALVLMFVAVAGALVGFRSAREAARQRDEARYNEGLGWMLRAQVAEERKNQYPETLLYAAQAIGFDGVGRPAEAPEGLLRFIRQDRNPEAYAAARKWISDRPAYLPVWASAVGSPATCLSVSSEGRWLALGSADGAVRVWDFLKDQEKILFPPGVETVVDVAFQPSAKLLAIAGKSGIRFWDLDKAVFIRTNDSVVTRLAWSPGGSTLAGAASDGTILLWKGSQRTVVVTGAEAPATSLAYSPDNSLVAAAFPGTGIRMVFPGTAAQAISWRQLESSRAISLDEGVRPGFLALVEASQSCSAVAVRPDGLRIVTGGGAGDIRVWDSASPRLLGQASQEQRHAGAVTQICFRPDGRQFATASAGGVIRLWSINPDDIPTIIATLAGHPGGVTGLQYLAGNNLLASAGADGRVRIWNVSGNHAVSSDLHAYLGQKWLRFNPAAQQELVWAGGTGFANLPTDSLVGVWRAGGAAAFARLMEVGDWSGAIATLTPEGREALITALLADARAGAEASRWNRVELRLGQLQALGADTATADLRNRRDAFGREGQSFTNATGIRLLWCSPGTFMMGSPTNEPGRRTYENQHRVTLSRGFWLGQFEVTQAEWVAVMGSNPSARKDSPLAPVENLSWPEAMEFCSRLTDQERARGAIPAGWEYSLPTEAQWEYACRAGTTTAYSFGNDPKDLHRFGNFNDRRGGFGSDSDQSQDDGWEYSAPVGQYLPNGWGFHDMHGNVWEWCRDSVLPTSADYPEGDAKDPWVTSGVRRVSRGGGFLNAAVYCRSANRVADLSVLPRQQPGSAPRIGPFYQI